MNKKRKFRTASQLLLIALLTTSATLPGFTTAITASADDDVQQVHQEAETNVSPKATGDLASGTFGTSEWRIDSEGVLHIGGGAFADTEERSPWTSYASKITKIVFEGTVLAGSNSAYLFSAGAGSGFSKVQTIEGMERFDTSNVTNMNQMFCDMSSLTSLDVSHFDTSNVTNMTFMFSGMSSLTSLDVSSFDTSNVTSMSYLFSGMSSLTSLDVSSFDTSNVTSMDSMFKGMSSLTSLDVSSFDTSNVTRMNAMFSGMSSLTSLDLSTFDTSSNKVTDVYNIFKDTSSLSQLKLGDKVSDMRDSGLPSLSDSGKYTGKWINVGKGTVDVPKGVYAWTSAEFMSNYDGSKHADTYVWQKDLTAVNVHDSTLQVGDTWAAEDNFDSAMTSDGYDVNFKDISVTGEVDTSQIGKYPILYSYNGMTETATVTVKEKETAPVQGGNVTVQYQDESGKSIADSVTIKGNIGETYTSTKKSISNYTYKETKGNATGKFTNKAQTVTYIYKKNATTTTPNKQETVNIYRLYNKKSQEHIYTSDKNEYTNLPKISKDWVQEGINFKGYKKSDSTAVAVRRVYNPKSGEHLTTTDAYEVTVLKSKGWKDEGVSFYAPKAGGTPIYRLYNPKAGLGAHFVTADAYEKKVLTTAPKEWKYEGIAWRSVK